MKRCYYHCRSCGRGHVPWDGALGLGAAALTPAASEAASIAGVQTSFAQSAEVTLHKLCGLRLSESTVERVTEGAGARLAKLLHDARALGATKPWAWQRDAHGRTCAYVGLDAVGVRQPGEQGARAEGRMAYVGLLYNPRSDHDDRRPERHQVRYLAGFYELDELGLQLRRQAAQVGWDSKAAACAGDPTAPTPSAISAPSTSARTVGILLENLPKLTTNVTLTPWPELQEVHGAGQDGRAI